MGPSITTHNPEASALIVQDSPHQIGDTKPRKDDLGAITAVNLVT